MTELERLVFMLNQHNYEFNKTTGNTISGCLRGQRGISGEIPLLIDKLISEGGKIREREESKTDQYKLGK